MTFCVSTGVVTWTNWLTLEHDPDHSSNVGTGLLSAMSYALQRGILLRRKNPTYRYWAWLLDARRSRDAWFWGVETPLSEVNALYRVSVEFPKFNRLCLVLMPNTFEILWKIIHNCLSNFSDTQTNNQQTNKHTNRGRNITFLTDVTTDILGCSSL